MASFRIDFKKSAEKDLRKIAQDQIPRLLNSIEPLGENPFPDGSKKLVGGAHSYRIRVGDYRVIYQVLRHRGVIEINRIRHRKDVYRE